MLLCSRIICICMQEKYYLDQTSLEKLYPPPPIGHDTKSHDPSRTNFKYFWGGNFAEKVTNQVNADCVEQN